MLINTLCICWSYVTEICKCTVHTVSSYVIISQHFSIVTVAKIFCNAVRILGIWINCHLRIYKHIILPFTWTFPFKIAGRGGNQPGPILYEQGRLLTVGRLRARSHFPSLFHSSSFVSAQVCWRLLLYSEGDRVKSRPTQMSFPGF